MKYKVLNNNFQLHSEDEILETLLKSRGVDNIKDFLNLSPSVVHNGMKLNNMGRALKCLKWHIDNGSKIHIIFDVDCDGITSGAIIYLYIKAINKNANLSYSINTGKKHGIILNELEGYEYDLLVVPDAGSNDMDACYELVNNRDKDIIILDHHIIESPNNFAIVINNQDEQYPNKHLTGAGVVYKFIKEFDKKYGYNNADEYLDLMSIGVIGDSADLRDLETRFLVLEGLKNIKNEFIKEILIRQKVVENIDEQVISINIEEAGWKVVPIINGVIRSGEAKDKIKMIKAILGEKEEIEYKPRKSKNNPEPQIEIQSLQRAMARECSNIKSKQDRLITKRVEKITEKITNEGLDRNKIIVVDGSDIIEEDTFTGLIANKLSGMYKRPVIVLKEKNTNEFGGSGRNYKLNEIESMREVLLNTQLIEVNGHENAFGVKIKKNLVEDLIKSTNESLKNMTIEDVYLVDFEIPVGRLKQKDITSVGKLEDVWGNTLNKPLFAITDITLNIEDIKLIGEKKNVIKIEKTIGNNKITFIKLFANEDLYNKMILKSTKGLSKKQTTKVKLDIVGEFTINKFNGNEYPQINIVDFNTYQIKNFKF